MEREAVDAWLQAFLRDHGGIAGTVHELTGTELVMTSAVNIPPPVIQATQRIPRGKGMAGLAWERNRAVSVCNLATDDSGDVRPAAKAVNAQAAVAIPVRAEGEVAAVVGIAFLGEREFDDAALARLEAAAATLLAPKG